MCSLCLCRIPVAPVTLASHLVIANLTKPTPQEISWDISYKLNADIAERLSSHPSIALLVRFCFVLFFSIFN